MRAIIWHPEARQDLREIIEYIADRNPTAAERLGDAIAYMTERLSDHPLAHRPGRIEGTREAVVHPNYIIVYQVGHDIEILAVVHARQQFP